jgi:mycothiol synthase
MPGSIAMVPSGSRLEILPCPPGEQAAAVGILYRRAPAPQRPGLVADLLAEAAAGLIDLSGLWIARRQGQIVATMLTQALAGRAAALWAPEVEPVWGRAALATALVRAVLDDFRARGFRVAQALVDGSSPRQGAADLARAGLPRVTELIYLGRATATPLPVGPAVPRLAWTSLAAATEAEFAAVLQATYIGSLDMPELESLRALDDVLESHRVGGGFDPARWHLGRLETEPDAAALVLLSAPPDRDTWEIAYLGLTPPARGRGLGRLALAYALDRARPHTPRLELAVDVRNHPAGRLYRAAGFIPFDRRAVHVAPLQPRSA